MSGLGTFFSEYLDVKERPDYNQSIAPLAAKEEEAPETDASEDEDDASKNDDPKPVKRKRLKAKLLQFLSRRLEEQVDIEGSPINDNTVPHVDNTVGTCRYVSELNLHAQLVQLDLCRVKKCWSFRHTRRSVVNCNDGRLWHIYRNVYSMELEQCFVSTSNVHDSTLRHMAQNLHPHSQQHTTVMVFLYDEYAAQMKAVDDHYRTSQADVFVSLSNVPAKCVLPTLNTDWFQNNPYEICIGSESRLKVVASDRPEHVVHFDSFDLQLDLLVMTKGKGGEGILQKIHRIQNRYGTVGCKTLTDAPILRVYQELQGSKKTKQTSDTDPATAANTDAADESNKRPRVDKEYQLLKDLKFTLEANVLLTDTKSVTVNICAVVLSFTQPQRSRKGDWFQSVTLIDDSLALCENAASEDSFVHSIVINIFVGHKQKERLPQLLYAGDVLLLHDVELSTWKDEEQLTGRNNSRYIVYRDEYQGPKPQDVVHATVSPPEAPLPPEQRARMETLWRWAQRRFLLHASMKLAHSFKLCDMKLQGTTSSVTGTEVEGDLCVMVTAVIPIPDELRQPTNPSGFLRVWDGTGPPISDPWPIDNPAGWQAKDKGDPPQSCLIRIAQIITKLQEIHSNPDLNPPNALSGRVATLAIWEKENWELIQQGAIVVGSFVRIRNVKDQKLFKGDFRCLHVHGKSSFTPIRDFVFEVVHLLEKHNNRLLRKEPTNTASGVLPLDWETIGGRAGDDTAERDEEETKEQDAPVTPPRQQTIQTHVPSPFRSPRPKRQGFLDRLDEFAAAPVGSKFEGQVRIGGLVPSLDSLSSGGLEVICPIGGASGVRYYQFGLSLAQNGSSTTIDAIISDNKGQRGFTGAMGRQLFGMSAAAAVKDGEAALENIKTILDANRLWNAVVQSVEYENFKYFLLHSIDGA